MRVADSDHMRGAAPTTCTTPPVSLCAVGVDHLSAGATPRSKLEVHYLSPSDLPCSSPRVLLFMCRQKPAMSSRGRSNKDARGVVSASRHPLVMSTRTLNVEAAREELELPEERGGGGVVSPPQPRQQSALRPWRETGTKVAFQGHGRVCWWAVRLPVATAQGHLLRQLQGRWPGRHGCGAQEAIVRQLQLVVGEQHALRQGHLRLRRVLPPVHQGGCQVTTVIVVPLLNSHRRQLCASFKHIPLCGHVYVCLSCYCVFSFDICHVSMLLC
ncbi:uncharacterized protein LOC119316620 isoform X3 [Triticum dicoccoides]|uniref:uncharacterized protein LOC119316620 isoform X3 n=1 Tax=Triticum dicoccoides TaxID=85692 RepID=UPI0018919640|nr:uncharacterized protein LOC119316620 isoform X3 [Triticum dicoccoides]